MTDKPDGGSAFPVPTVQYQRWGDSRGGGEIFYQPAKPGMSLRAYAAIKLRVPDSGLLWLDEMIEKSMLKERGK